MTFSHYSSKIGSQIESPRSRNAKLSEVVACQSEPIVKLETDFNMLYELVMDLARSFPSLVTFSNISIGSIHAAVEGEKTVQQTQ